MMKYLVIIVLSLPFVFCNAVQAKLLIKLEQPELLLAQLTAIDVGIQPVINEDERQYSALISEKLKAKQYKALLDTLSDALKAPLAAEQVSAAMAYLVAQLALQQQNYILAQHYFEQALKKATNYAKAYHGLGLAQLQLQQYQQANTNLSKALQLGVNDPQLYSYLGFGYLQSNNFHSAVVAYQQAKLFSPNDEQINQSLLYAYNQAGQSDAALSLLTQMLERQPNTSDLWLNRANVYLQLKNYQRVISSLETALRLGESSNENIGLTAQLQLQHGSINRAVELYQHLWQQGGASDSVIEAITYLISIDQLATAQKWLSQLPISPSVSSHHQSQLYYLTGKVYQVQGKLINADHAFKQALTVNSIYGEALLAAAQVKRSLGQSHQAQMLLLRASSLEEVQLAALTEHADLMMSLNRYEKALQYLEEALRSAPHESSIIENVKILQRLVQQSENS